ncbi:MAG: phospholipase [Prevotella sp.]|nr:phospholipase [Prevotella sp.]MCM1075170.1 hypothetical protein [Ruminococcus sp.]
MIILAVTALIGLILWFLDKRHKTAEPENRITESPESDEECCGMHAVCEKQLLSPVSAEYEYFDDEELDTFKGREADSYTEEEIEAFRDVLLTLPPEEVPEWSKSIQLRGITLPLPIRDELLLIVSDTRSMSTNSTKNE